MKLCLKKNKNYKISFINYFMKILIDEMVMLLHENIFYYICNIIRFFLFKIITNT